MTDTLKDPGYSIIVLRQRNPKKETDNELTDLGCDSESGESEYSLETRIHASGCQCFE